jgi:hypothetical protein
MDGCLVSLLGDEDKGMEIVLGEEKYFVLGLLEQPRQNKFSCTGTTSQRTDQGRTPFICPL